MRKFILFLSSTLLLFSSVHAEHLSPVTYSRSNFDDWYYKRSAPYQGWKYIVIHHSATQVGSVSAFHRFHTQQGYGGIAYHFVIGNGQGMPDGEVQATFRWQRQIAGTHVSVNSWGHNIFGIGICLVGNLENSAPTQAQIVALQKLVWKLRKDYDIKPENIVGHKHVLHDDASGKTEQTVCPGKKFHLNKIYPVTD